MRRANVVRIALGNAIDAHLVSGGLPGILAAWPHATPALRFIARECEDPTSPVFSVPESTLLAEFPLPDQARRVIESIGSGDRTRANIAAAAGGWASRSTLMTSLTYAAALRRYPGLHRASRG